MVRVLKKTWWASIPIGSLLLFVVIIGVLFLCSCADWVIPVVYHPFKVDNPEASNPTFVELVGFLEGCKYKEITTDPNYVCIDYAHALHDGAESEGIRSALVIARIDDGVGGLHAFNAFETTDYGIIYVDPWRGCFWGRGDTSGEYNTRCAESYNLHSDFDMATQNGEWFVGGIMFYPGGFARPDNCFNGYEALRNEEGYYIYW